MPEEDEDDYYEGDYPAYTDLTGLLVTTPRITMKPAPRGRVIGEDTLMVGCVCRCGCGPSWAVQFEDPRLNPNGYPFAFFGHDLTPFSPLEQLASLASAPQDDTLVAPDELPLT